jgi:transposase
VTLRYLRTYSPDLIPIEQVLDKISALLRKAAKRTIPATLGQDWRPSQRQLAVRVRKYVRDTGYDPR